MLLLQVGIGATDQFITNFFQNDLFQAVTIQMTKQTQAIALGLAMFLFLLSLGYNYVKNAIDSVSGSDTDGKIVDIKDVVRMIVIMFFISIYSLTILPAVNGSVRAFNSLTVPSQAQQDKFGEEVKSYMEKQKSQQLNDKKRACEQILKNPNSKQEDKDAAQEMLNDMSNEDSVINKVLDSINPVSLIERFLAWFNGQFWNMLSGMVKLVVGVLAVILFKFLLVIGPLALAASIVPVFKNQVDIWFGTLINTGLVITTMHILDCFLYGMISIIWKADSFTFQDMYISNTVNAVTTILYLMAFWLTGKWIGKGDGGKFVSKTVTLATLAAVAAVGAGVMAAKGGSGGRTFGNVMDVFKNKKGGAASKASQTSKDMFDDGEHHE